MEALVTTVGVGVVDELNVLVGDVQIALLAIDGAILVANHNGLGNNHHNVTCGGVVDNTVTGDQLGIAFPHDLVTIFLADSHSVVALSPSSGNVGIGVVTYADEVIDHGHGGGATVFCGVDEARPTLICTLGTLVAKVFLTDRHAVGTHYATGSGDIHNTGRLINKVHQTVNCGSSHTNVGQTTVNLAAVHHIGAGAVRVVGKLPSVRRDPGCGLSIGKEIHSHLAGLSNSCSLVGLIQFSDLLGGLELVNTLPGNLVLQSAGLKAICLVDTHVGLGVTGVHSGLFFLAAASDQDNGNHENC